MHPATIASVPREPGVYLFNDDTGAVLYVGKARDLRRRVSSYFRAQAARQFKTRALMERAHGIELLIVSSEWEALLLEACLIRSLRPRYNTRLRDSRGYPFLRIDVESEAPRVGLTDRVLTDGAAYFGPVPEAATVHAALEVIRRLYLLRPESFERGRLDADARQMAVDMLDLATGRGQGIHGRIRDAMAMAANALDFERALRIRQALAATRRIAGYPRVMPGANPPGRDVAVIDRIALDLPLTRSRQC